MIKDCPTHKKKLAAKKPGQKRSFGHFTHQEDIGAKNSPTEESNKGDAKKQIDNDTEEDSNFGKRDE